MPRAKRINLEYASIRDSKNPVIQTVTVPTADLDLFMEQT